MTQSASAYSVVRSVNPETVRQDGYVGVGSDGITQESTLEVTSVVSSFTHLSTGSWTCTLKSTWPSALTVLSPPFPSPNPVTNSSALLWFKVEVVYPSNPGSDVLSVAMGPDNINTNGTDGDGVIHFYLLNSSGTLTDLPALGGFRFDICLQASGLYL